MKTKKVTSTVKELNKTQLNTLIGGGVSTTSGADMDGDGYNSGNVNSGRTNGAGQVTEIIK